MAGQTLALQQNFPSSEKSQHSGVYIVQNTVARGGGEMVPGKKMKNEAVGNKMKKKEKSKKGERKKKKRKRGRLIFFLNIWHTSVDHCILT